MFLIQLRRKGVYSENNHFGAARALRPNLLRRPLRLRRGSLPEALFQLAWVHLKAIEATAASSWSHDLTLHQQSHRPEGDHSHPTRGDPPGTLTQLLDRIPTQSVVMSL